MGYRYETNIKLVESLYNSGFVEENSDASKNSDELTKRYKLLMNMIDLLMVDPDAKDNDLYQALNEYYKEFKFKVNNENEFEKDGIRYSLDCIVNWKTIFIKKNGKENAEWLKDYECVRKSMKSHVFFPKHKLSINTERGLRLEDRIDYTLYDIFVFFENIIKKNISFDVFSEKAKKIKEKEEQSKKSKEPINIEYKLYLAYMNEITFNWLKNFGSFKSFIEQMKLSFFVKYNEIDEIEGVYDLSSKKGSDLNLIENLDKISKPDLNYLENLLDYFKKSPVNLK